MTRILGLIVQPRRRIACRPQQRGAAAFDGFSLVEIVIAMMLFAFLAVAILPLIISVTQLTVVNSDSVQAKAAAQQKLAAIQRDYPTDSTVRVYPSLPVGKTRDCSALPVSTSPQEEMIEGRLTVRTVAGTCPAVYPGTVSIKVTVIDSAGTTIAKVHSSVRVTQ